MQDIADIFKISKSIKLLKMKKCVFYFTEKTIGLFGQPNKCLESDYLLPPPLSCLWPWPAWFSSGFMQLPPLFPLPQRSWHANLSSIFTLCKSFPWPSFPYILIRQKRQTENKSPNLCCFPPMQRHNQFSLLYQFLLIWSCLHPMRLPRAFPK